MSDTFATVIIPAHNEAVTVGAVVDAALAASFVSRVVVVSDGSTDDTERVARVAGADVISLPVQSGKGAALMHGVAEADTDVVVFLDADLQGLRPDHVDALIRPVQAGQVVMQVGLRDRGAMARWVEPHLLWLSGQRALRREVFLSVDPNARRGYRVEASLNVLCRKHGWKYEAVLLDGLRVCTKFTKVGWKALPQYVKMWGQVFFAYALAWISVDSSRTVWEV